MDNVHFLNLEYFLLLVYRIFTGSNVDISQIPAETLKFMEYAAWAGLALSVVLGIIVFYARNRMHEVEHAGWHKRDKQVEALQERVVHSAKNLQWEHIMMLAASPNESDWRRAIIEADIMLDNMLAARGYSQFNVGDKLKAANKTQFTTLDLARAAHAVRNDIAHGGESFHLTERDTKTTIDQYRRVFEEFDYI